MAKYVKTLAALASEVGVSSPMLTYYRKRGAPIIKADGQYDVSLLKSWLCRNIRGKVAENQGEVEEEETNEEEVERIPRKTPEISGDDIEAFKDLYIKERALREQSARELMDLKVSIEKGRYLPKDEIDNANVQRIHAVKTGLMSLPRRLAQDMMGLNANQMESMMKKRFREILERFAKM